MEDNNITIGSDPEFVIMCGDSVANALEIFSKVFIEDLACIEPEEPHIYDITITYLKNPEHYLNEALNNIDIKTTTLRHPRFAAELFVNMLIAQVSQQVDANDIIKKIINILNITKEEIDESMSEILSAHITSGLRIHEGYGKIQFQELPFHIKSKLLWITVKNKMLYKNMDIHQHIPDKKKEEFKDKFKDKVMEYYSRYSDAGFPNLVELSQTISEYIKDDIIENWEYEQPDEYKEYFCSAEIGCDGHSVTGEMRPRHGNDPIEHFNEILKLMKELEERLKADIICYGKELQIKAGAVQGLAYGEETILLGGHIHIGYEYGQRDYSDYWLCKMLSIFVGIPLTLIEKPEEISMRRPIYGSFEDCKPKDYGLEFRMLSSWLISPQITIGALALTYVVADEFITNLRTKTKRPSITLVFQENTTYEDIYNKTLEDLKNYELKYEHYGQLFDLSEELYINIKTMRLYPEYKEYIDYIFNMIKNKETWNSDADILVTWSELF